MHRWVFILGIFLAAVGVGAGAVIALDPFGDEQIGSPPSMEEIAAANATEVARAANLDTQIPTLTDEDVARVREIVEGDATLRALLDDQRLRIDGMGIWHDGPEKLGAGLSISLDSPIDIDRDLPIVLGSSDESDHTAIRTVRHFELTDVKALHLLVDIQEGKIASIRPDTDGIPTETPTPAPSSR